ERLPPLRRTPGARRARDIPRVSELDSVLSREPAVREFLGGQPGLTGQIRALSRSVIDAGVRVRDAGLMKNRYELNLRIFTPAEIWLFDLAISRHPRDLSPNLPVSDVRNCETVER